MIVGVISDTHGLLRPEAVRALAGSQMIIHAGDVGAPEILIDLRQIKDRLQGPPGQQVANEVIAAIPTCRADQQPQLSLTQLPECIPPVFDRTVIAEQVAATLSSAAAQMPSQVDIGPRLAPGTGFGLMFDGRRIGVEMLDTSLLLLVVITIGMWVIGALIGREEQRGRWLWLGGSLLVGAIAVLTISLFVFIFGAALLPQAWLADLSTEASALARGLLQAFMQQLAVRSLIAGGVWFIMAGVVIWLGMLQKPRRVVSPQYRS